MAPSSSVKKAPTEAVLFDIGGVLLQLDYREAFREFALGGDAETHAAMTQVGNDAAYDAFERGTLSELDYFQSLSRKLERPFEVERFRRLWNGIIGEPYPGIPELLTTLATTVPIYALSNSNETHITHVLGRFPWFSSFREVFSSHQLGYRKPERSIYVEAATRMDLAPEKILFFDDRADNVAAAEAFGMSATLVKDSPKDIVATLRARLPHFPQ